MYLILSSVDQRGEVHGLIGVARGSMGRARATALETYHLLQLSHPVQSHSHTNLTAWYIYS
jgi:hypothetical protein